ncbi:MAG: universal stress protein [Burkholderiales bacterium]
MTDILLAFDGSESALRAVRHVVALADLVKPRVHLLHARDPLHLKDIVLVKDSLKVIEQIERAHLDAGMEALAPAKAILNEAGLESEPHVVIGDAAQTIVDTAAGQRCQLIVMGTRGLGMLQSLMVGSVASKVVHLAEIPVMLVK